MTARNKLLTAVPYPVESALHKFGRNLRTARIRRNLTIAQAAERIGTGPRAVMDAEKGKPSTGIAVYAALLWLFDVLEPLEELANPLKDERGLALLATRERKRSRVQVELDNDF